MCQHICFNSPPRFWGFDTSPPDSFANKLEGYKTARMQVFYQANWLFLLVLKKYGNNMSFAIEEKCKHCATPLWNQTLDANKRFIK